MRALLPIVLVAACSHAAVPPATPAAAPAAPAAPSVTHVIPVPPTPALAAGMARLGFMRGVWTGPATGTGREGPYAVTQTERMGPMLGGDVVVIEGRGYRTDGTTGFNAFAVVSYDPRADKYEIRSYAQGMAGTFELRLTADGYTWEVPAGPGAIVRFTATVKDNHWREVGAYIAAGKDPVPTFEMNLTRVGDTDWPLGTPIAPTAAAAR